VKGTLLLLLLGFGCLSGALPQGTNRQTEDIPRVAVFKGNSTATPPELKRLHPPSALSASIKENIYKQLGIAEPGSLYVRLTASQPTLANKAALVFRNADSVNTGQAYARWHPGKYSSPEACFLELWLRSGANRRYLIDCAVEEEAPLRNPRSWSVVGPDNTTQTWSASATHLVFTLDAATAGWYKFAISGVNRSWNFHSCEVTNL